MNDKLYKVVITFPNGRYKVFNKVRVLSNDSNFVELQSEKGGTVWTIVRENTTMVQISDIPRLFNNQQKPDMDEDYQEVDSDEEID